MGMQLKLALPLFLIITSAQADILADRNPIQSYSAVAQVGNGSHADYVFCGQSQDCQPRTIKHKATTETPVSSVIKTHIVLDTTPIQEEVIVKPQTKKKVSSKHKKKCRHCHHKKHRIHSARKKMCG